MLKIIHTMIVCGVLFMTSGCNHFQQQTQTNNAETMNEQEVHVGELGSIVHSGVDKKQVQQKSFDVEKGSLRDNAIRLSLSEGWYTDRKEWLLSYDLHVPTSYTILYHSIDDGLTTLLDPYKVTAILLDHTKKIVFEER